MPRIVSDSISTIVITTVGLALTGVTAVLLAEFSRTLCRAIESLL